jgi:L-arabinose isomerase
VPTLIGGMELNMNMNMPKLKIGLLPLYIKLYDISLPQMRKRIDEFHQIIIDEFKKRDIQVIVVPVCRVESEFIVAVEAFEKEDVDAIVTLHLAYSPSLESSKVIANTKLPVIVLNTTPAFRFTPNQDEEEILYNHGIHGVQDMCNLMKRNKKNFLLESGHWEKSDVLDRIKSCVRAARMAKTMHSARVGTIGGPFIGMGDFAVPYDDLYSQIGVKTITFDTNICKEMLSKITDNEIEAEISEDLTLFKADNIDIQSHKQSVKAGLVVRKWMEKENLSSITINFLAVDSTLNLPCMPFLEVSKAMGRGKGYAGEGDVLTAALVGTLLQVYPETSFTEMFCADWEGNSIFLSHMGEMNLNLASEKPRLIEKDFPYTDAQNPVTAYARFKEGRSALVNLAPSEDGTYTLIVCTGQMLGVSGEDKMKDTIHGWFKPDIPVDKFLTTYSLAGGTHHLAVVYGEVIEEIKKFGIMMGWKVIS